MAKRFKLKEGYARVFKSDITKGVVVFLRKDIDNGVRSPYGYNIVGRTGRIGIRGNPVEKPSDLHKWVYCADLCKNI